MTDQEPVHVEIGPPVNIALAVQAAASEMGDWLTSEPTDEKETTLWRCREKKLGTHMAILFRQVELIRSRKSPGEAGPHEEDCVSDGRYGLDIIYPAFESKNICHAATEPAKGADCQHRIVCTEAGKDLC
ncbi:unnamed protein product [Clonostachys solani]|uniref:Uncharacterized protein n=1 Tax=Clonostachys solani TaxID=160281 RepID=A0A9N9ZFP5_9HYPO|nr:unnamed protein product [Clonostachys solani]